LIDKQIEVNMKEYNILKE